MPSWWWSAMGLLTGTTLLMLVLSTLYVASTMTVFPRRNPKTHRNG